MKSDLGSPELDSYDIPLDERKKMVLQALRVRKFLRVKVADDADLDLLKDSLQLILAFFQNLDALMARLEGEGQLQQNTRQTFIFAQLGEPFKHKFREGPQGPSIFENDRDYFKY